MKRVAIFGNAGGGKSTLARRLSNATGLPLYALDLIRFRADGSTVAQEDYAKAHADILARNEWIIEGYGCPVTLRERLAVADTLIYLDLPLLTHYRWVAKRLVKGLFVNPEGWPPHSRVWQGSLQSFRVIRLCDRDLTPQYRAYTASVADIKRVHHLRSRAQIEAFLRTFERGAQHARPGEPAT
jgi:adenylate kinase family enzyme